MYFPNRSRRQSENRPKAVRDAYLNLAVGHVNRRFAGRADINRRGRCRDADFDCHRRRFSQNNVNAIERSFGKAADRADCYRVSSRRHLQNALKAFFIGRCRAAKTGRAAARGAGASDRYRRVGTTAPCASLTVTSMLPVVS